MSEVPRPCYGCRHLDYRGPASVTGRPGFMGGTAIPLREQDARNGPGEYRCSKFATREGVWPVIARADHKDGPRELEPGCKDVR